MTAIKTQIVELENKIVEYQQLVGNQGLGEDLPAGGQNLSPAIESVVTESVEDEFDDVMDIELEPSDDLPFYDDIPVSEAADDSISESAQTPINNELDDEPQPELESEPELEPEPQPANEPESEPELELEPESELEPEPSVAPMPVIDAMIAKQTWRNDMPGSSVRDIRSAISLNDRILFINYLFGEDPMAFQEMLTQLNAMSSFDEAAAHVISAHPEWDLESDTVYRFMMALRRRHQ